MDVDVDEIKRTRRLREPLTYCRWVTNRPGLWFGLTLGGHLFITSINIILGVSGYEILPIEFEEFPIDIMDEITYQREHAWVNRNAAPNNITRFTVDDVGPTWSRGYAIDTVTLYYSAGDDGNNVFQKDYFIQMKSLEDSLFSVDEYQTTFCLLNVNQSCVKPNSILRYFDGTYISISSTFYDPDFNNIEGVLNEANTNVETMGDFQYFLGEGYVITPETSVSHVTRTGIPLGWPLEGSNDTKVDMNKIEEFLESTFTPALDAAQDSTNDGLMMNYFSVILFQAQVLPQAIKDMMLAIGSLLFIFIIMWIQTRSLWITGWAVTSIITSFWITNLIYRTIFNYAYFGYFHVISIFIVLGIGADDIFVFYNTWRATGHESYPSVAHRMSDCYRRCAATMFFTSFTTMMAFLVGGFSPVLPLGSFGIFTGVLIAVNYISVIIFFPTVIIMHHVYFEKQCCPCCFCPAVRCDKSRSHVCPRMSTDTREADKGDSEPYKMRKKHPFVRFFAGPYFRFVTHKVARWFIIVIFTGLLAFFIWSATRIESTTESVKVYRDNTNMGKAMYLADEFVPTGDEHVILYLVWGLKPTDTSDCHYTDYHCDGVKSYDESFDMNTPPTQRALLNFCNKLKNNLTVDDNERLQIRNNSKTGERAVDCFLEELNNYINVSYPLAQNNMEAFMATHAHIYQPEDLGVDFYRYFEIGVSHWLTNSYTMLSQPDYFIYNSLVGEAHDEPYTQSVPIQYNMTVAHDLPDVYYGTKLQYATIQVNLTLSDHGLGYKDGLPVMENWETFLNEQIQQMPIDLHGGFQVTNGTWHWLVIQQKLEKGAWFGITIGISIAFPVLVIATMNIIVGLIATLLICCVTASVLGIIPLAGWKIDIMISMNLTLLVGLSVDYIVHLAEGYHLSEHSTRLDRVQDMLENLGISVIMGSVTTLGAAFFMLFSKIMFFFQFGTFLFCIIGFSLAFSLIFFPALMSLIGPEGNTGSIKTPFKKLHYKRIGRRDSDVRCSSCNGKGFTNRDGDNDSITDSKDLIASGHPNNVSTENKPMHNGISRNTSTDKAEGNVCNENINLAFSTCREISEESKF